LNPECRTRSAAVSIAADFHFPIRVFSSAGFVSDAPLVGNFEHLSDRSVMFLVGQIREAAQASSEVLRAAGQYDASTFIAVIIVGAVVVITVLLIWKVVIPYFDAKMIIEKESAKSSRENSEKLSQAVSTCLPVISSTHDIITRTSEVTENTDLEVHKMSMILRVGIIAIEKLAKEAKIDIQSELDRIHGILGDGAQ